MAVLAVSDPRAILSALDEIVTPDIILNDYHLGPDLGGTEVVAAVRALCGHAVHAIVVTADRAPAMQAQASAASCSLMHKPIKPAQPHSLLSSLIG